MFSSRLRFTSAITACAAIGALAACSTGGTPAALTQTPSMPPPSQLLSTVKSAALGASAVHIKGSGTDSGSKVSMDLQLNKDSTAGTIGQGGTDVTIKYVDKVMYVELTKDLLTSQGADPNSPQTQAIENKWVPSTSQLASGMASALQPMTGYSSFVGGLFGSLPNETPKQTGTDTVDGTPVTVYTFQDGSKADVATSTPHFLLRLIAPKSEGGQLDFTGWNQPVTVTKPAASEIYNGPGA